jgi:hypothetical protein
VSKVVRVTLFLILRLRWFGLLSINAKSGCHNCVDCVMCFVEGGLRRATDRPAYTCGWGQLACDEQRKAHDLGDKGWPNQG